MYAPQLELKRHFDALHVAGYERSIPGIIAPNYWTLMFDIFSSHDPLPTVPRVDVDRFMGDWYVHGNIPTFVERNAHNAVESYARSPNDSSKIETVFAFRKGRPGGAIKVMEPTGFVDDDGNGAKWGMQFLWPIKAEYLIVHLDEEYTETIVGRTKRDYVWIMTRDSSIDEARYEALVERVAAMGYDASDIRRVPQSWPDPGHPVSKAEGALGSQAS